MSADENNPFGALAHLQQAADSRVSTSSMQGVRIAPIDPDSLNAASSYPNHAFAHGSAHDRQRDTRSAAHAHAAQYVSTGAQYGSPGTPTRFRDGPGRQRRGTGDGYVTAEDVAYGSTAPESGRTCDIFRGQHGEPTLSRYPPVMFPPLRRAHSTPEMQLEPLCELLHLSYSLLHPSVPSFAPLLYHANVLASVTAALAERQSQRYSSISRSSIMSFEQFAILMYHMRS